MKMETQYMDNLWDAIKAVLEEVYNENTYIKEKSLK